MLISESLNFGLIVMKDKKTLVKKVIEIIDNSLSEAEKVLIENATLQDYAFYRITNGRFDELTIKLNKAIFFVHHHAEHALKNADYLEFFFSLPIFSNVDPDQRIKLHLYILDQLSKIGHEDTHGTRKEHFDNLINMLTEIRIISNRDNSSERVKLFIKQINSFENKIKELKRLSAALCTQESIPELCREITNKQGELFRFGLSILIRVLTPYVNAPKNTIASLSFESDFNINEYHNVEIAHPEIALKNSNFSSILRYLTSSKNDFQKQFIFNRTIMQGLLNELNKVINAENICNVPSCLNKILNLNLNENQTVNDNELYALVCSSMFYDLIESRTNKDIFAGTSLESISYYSTTSKDRLEILAILSTFIISLMNLRASSIKYRTIQHGAVSKGDDYLQLIEKETAFLENSRVINELIINDFNKSCGLVIEWMSKNYLKYYTRSLISWGDPKDNIKEKVISLLIEDRKYIETIINKLHDADGPHAGIKKHIEYIGSKEHKENLKYLYQDILVIEEVLSLFPPGNLSQLNYDVPILNRIRNMTNNFIKFTFDPESNISHSLNIDQRTMENFDYFSHCNQEREDIMKTYLFNENNISVALKIQRVLNNNNRNVNSDDLELSNINDNFCDDLYRKIYQRVLVPYDTIVNNRLIAFFSGYSYSKLDTLKYYNARLILALKIIDTELAPLKESNYFIYELQFELINSCLYAFLNKMAIDLPGHEEVRHLAQNITATGKYTAVIEPLRLNAEKNQWEGLTMEHKIRCLKTKLAHEKEEKQELLIKINKIESQLTYVLQCLEEKQKNQYTTSAENNDEAEFNEEATFNNRMSI